MLLLCVADAMYSSSSTTSSLGKMSDGLLEAHDRRERELVREKLLPSYEIVDPSKVLASGWKETELGEERPL
jgi:hypothetical protein